MTSQELAYHYVQHTNRCIFLTGKAGTGKTTFLRRLKEECPKQMAVVAPTGVAAINAEGVTIHSLFQLPPQLFLPTEEARRQLFAEMQMRANKQRVLRNLELLVIDEVSMVRADLLDTIDAVLRHFKHRPTIPFGGVQLLVIGDLFQLSPVVREEEWRLLQPYYEGPYFFQARVFRELRPVYIEFEHVYRQTNQDFVTILNQVRNNELTPESLQVLNGRVQEFRGSGEAITLSTHNSKVDAINQREMDALTGKEHTYKATITDTFPESMYPVDEQLTLKVGARVMFIKNDSSTDKLYYNGKLGVVTSLSKQAINVLCDDGTEVNVHNEVWENIRYNADSGSDQVQTEIIGTFSHYPLRLAWAITIHKAQGLTFDQLVIDAEDAFAAGQVYVALSRCRSLEGLTLLTPIPTRALTNAREVLQFTDQQDSIQTIEENLQPAQKEYLTMLLCALFDFREHTEQLYALQRMANNMTSLQIPPNEYFSDLITPLLDWHGVGERFQQQIHQLMYNDQLDKLQERLLAASQYYAPKIYELLKAMTDCPLRSNNQSDAAQLKQNLLDIYAALSRKAYLQAQMAQQVSVEAYFEARKTYKYKEPSLTIYTTQRKSRVNATTFQTMTLLHQGYRIKDIAKHRKMTQRTVIKHLKTLLEDGVLELHDFHPADRVWVKG
ncbi:MAG: AAA family ATPase [Paludibacteraceae bacterium]|nr:AAA family ATPase [Paludibacteraceae bacterium]